MTPEAGPLSGLHGSRSAREGLFDQGCCSCAVAGSDEGLRLVLGSNVVGRPHFFYAQFSSDVRKGVRFLSERE